MTALASRVSVPRYHEFIWRPLSPVLDCTLFWYSSNNTAAANGPHEAISRARFVCLIGYNVCHIYPFRPVLLFSRFPIPSSIVWALNPTPKRESTPTAVAVKLLTLVSFLQVETVMVGLERLWHSGVIPGDWDTAAFGGSGDMVSAPKNNRLHPQYRAHNKQNGRTGPSWFSFL